MRAIVACHDARVRKRLEAGFDRLRFPYHCYESPALAAAGRCGDHIFCIDSQAAASLHALPGPTLIILSDAQISDRLFALVGSQSWSVLHLDDLHPEQLLRSVISTLVKADVNQLVASVLRLPRFRNVPAGVVTAFLQNAAQMTRLQDLRRHLGPLSRPAAQELIRSSGFSRAEHLFTALRCALWILLGENGLNRAEVEQYLGILDRGSFRRACRRAEVPTLREGLRLDAFEAPSRGGPAPRPRERRAPRAVSAAATA
jgi:hypothetical protein